MTSDDPLHIHDQGQALKKTRTKETAEAALNELPSVVGAFVREDVHGHPREVHLLVGPGPNVRLFARDVRSLLEERLGVPVDQRVISIAQIVDPDARHEAPVSLEAAPTPQPVTPAPGRVVFSAAEARVRDGRVEVVVSLERDGQEYLGDATELESPQGRARAAAAATLRALSESLEARVQLDLESASVIRALDREFVVVAVSAHGPALGRQPRALVGAHPTEYDDVAIAGALATLKAVNRVATLSVDGAELRRSRGSAAARQRP